jgi:hypothetical protein
MNALTRPLIIALALTAAPIAIASAQEERITPEAIADDAPTAKQARAAADVLLGGDRRKIDAFFATNGAPAFTGSATYASDLTAILETLKTGARSIVRMDGIGPSRVAAALATAPGAEPERAIVVGMDPAAPYRITSLRLARIQVD